MVVDSYRRYEDGKEVGKEGGSRDGVIVICNHDYL